MIRAELILHCGVLVVTAGSLAMWATENVAAAQPTTLSCQQPLHSMPDMAANAVGSSWADAGCLQVCWGSHSGTGSS